MSSTTSQRRYAVAGGVLATGAPLGLLLVRSLRAGRWPRPRWIAAEVASAAHVYAYVGLATTVAFALFGRLLGRAEDRRRAAQRESLRLRDEHEAVIAHDLRNPIQTIQLQATLLLEEVGAEGPDGAALQRIQRGARRLEQMVAHLIDASQLELSRLRLDRRAIDPARAAAEIIDGMLPTLGDRAVTVEVEGTPPEVSADPSRLDEILGNLVENAARYSPAGTPIRVVVAPDAGGARVSVIDRGSGIAASELPRLFDRYYQTRQARARKGGLGLGLFITRGLVDAHGGRVWVQSEPGHGSTFHVWLPAARSG